MDKIILSNLGFYGYHGVLTEEKKIGQKFFVDVELYTDTREAGRNDDIKSSVNYAEVYEIVKSVVENEVYDLIEAVAENIASEILKEFNRVKGVMVRIKKPEAPVKGIYDYFGVEIKRGR
ncbi:MAG: dihydroneopterin aldolase [Clostridioides sp.]|nr:dihydroneopterin aldolase [Clostridioides sp.]